MCIKYGRPPTGRVRSVITNGIGDWLSLHMSKSTRRTSPIMDIAYRFFQQKKVFQQNQQPTNHTLNYYNLLDSVRATDWISNCSILPPKHTRMHGQLPPHSHAPIEYSAASMYGNSWHRRIRAIWIMWNIFQKYIPLINMIMDPERHKGWCQRSASVCLSVHSSLRVAFRPETTNHDHGTFAHHDCRCWVIKTHITRNCCQKTE